VPGCVGTSRMAQNIGDQASPVPASSAPPRRDRARQELLESPLTSVAALRAGRFTRETPRGHLTYGPGEVASGRSVHAAGSAFLMSLMVVADDQDTGSGSLGTARRLREFIPTPRDPRLIGAGGGCLCRLAATTRSRACAGRLVDVTSLRKD
jgi:hypothetical protein